MKRLKALSVAVLVFGAACAYGEDVRLLKAKAELLVEQAHELLLESQRKGSELHEPQYQYYFGLMYTAGSNLLARTGTKANERQLRSYLDLIEKDYKAYTKISEATEKAAATGSSRGKNGNRHRAKRLINAEKLRDKELAEAIRRWERFVEQTLKGRR